LRPDFRKGPEEVLRLCPYFTRVQVWSGL
jgi:hypothetical protein